MLVRMMASMGESDTITRYLDLLDSLVEGAKDSVAATANRAALPAPISPIGFRPTALIGSDELRRRWRARRFTAFCDLGSVSPCVGIKWNQPEHVDRVAGQRAASRAGLGRADGSESK